MATYGTYNSPGPVKITIYGLGILFAFLIVFYVTRSMYRESYHDLRTSRAAQRLTARQELQAKSATLLNEAGWVNSNKAIVRLPIARAMQLTVEAYQNPEAARSNLMSRSEKAAAPEPKAPEKPSEFE